MASKAETSSYHSEVNSWIRCAGITVFLAGMVLASTSGVAAQIACGRGWRSVGGEVTTLMLQDGVRVNPRGRNFESYSVSELSKGQELRVDVSSGDFYPRLLVFRRMRGEDPRVAYAVGNPARIRLRIPVDGDYVVVITTDRPGNYGQYTWDHLLCEQGTRTVETTIGPPCSAEWSRDKANYSDLITSVDWPNYQALCTLGGCSTAGSKDGRSWPMGYRVYSTRTRQVEFYRELYDPRLDQTFYCKPRPSAD